MEFDLESKLNLDEKIHRTQELSEYWKSRLCEVIVASNAKEKSSNLLLQGTYKLFMLVCLLFCIEYSDSQRKVLKGEYSDDKYDELPEQELAQ